MMFATLTRLAERIRALFRSRRLDDELDVELNSHLDMLTEDNIQRGMSPDEAAGMRAYGWAQWSR
jgi:hypothetical protein